jgi:hypothetical protein
MSRTGVWQGEPVRANSRMTAVYVGNPGTSCGAVTSPAVLASQGIRLYLIVVPDVFCRFVVRRLIAERQTAHLAVTLAGQDLHRLPQRHASPACVDPPPRVQRQRLLRGALKIQSTGLLSRAPLAASRMCGAGSKPSSPVARWHRRTHTGHCPLPSH